MFKNTLQVEREREDAEGTHAFRNIVYIKLCSKTLCKWRERERMQKEPMPLET
jgi:hypothetical protein